ncbi:uncharacterized protein LOC114576537 [Exaiptasia diaphana]|uniref:C2H2-type domain-containing protein n=1 Tax=Exaiptasia diaphana TaxID=2652724 RepID=A0A913YVA2_EXADI|nr:uncharacterized protein LOC114576537 [Exaiptasia diaphana]KXJ06720.1 hypothetical protein AC249_AIPGENE27443 [Exaiptasia diaphana]
MSFLTHCPECYKSFKSRTTLRKHYTFKHNSPQHQSLALDFVDKDGKAATIPTSETFPTEKLPGYYQWLAGLVESINESLHPMFPGKWITLNMWQVKPEYFCKLAADMNALPDNIRDTSHKKRPFYRKSTRRISYKVFDISLVQGALSKQDIVELKPQLLFSSGNDIINRPQSQRGNISQLLAAAKARAFVRRTEQSVANETPSNKCAILVKEPEGRISREFELIWWPKLYTLSGLGKLDVRYYLEKIAL